MKLKIAILSVLSILALTSLAPSAGALSRPPNGKYNCYIFLDYPVFTGRYIKVTGATTYSWFDTKKTRSGSYRNLGAQRKVRFTSGPLRGKTAVHRVFSNGKHGLELVIQTPSGPGNYTCSQA